MNQKQRLEYIDNYNKEREKLQIYKDRILDAFDLEELCDLLEIEPDDILTRFEDKVLDYADKQGWTQANEDGPEDSQERDEANT
jgi:DNA-binding Xre family transcriptional regulator